MTAYRKHLQRVAINTAAFCILMGMAGCVSRNFYYPDSKVYTTPAAKGLKYEAVTFTSRDGTRLCGWFVPATGKPIGTVIHFHGNAQNMTAHFSFVDWLPKEGFNLFVFDYRGYGGSEGKVTRRGVYNDSAAAIRYIQSRKDIDPEKILILGQSLGGANAIAVIGRNKFKGIRAVAIDSTFYSYRKIVRDKMKEMPIISLLRWPLSFILIGNRYSPGPVVDKISPIPLLLAHGALDRVIPFNHGRKLFDEAGEPKQFLPVKNGRHTETFLLEPNRRKLVDFYKKALK